jgi:hypothetical protein
VSDEIVYMFSGDDSACASVSHLEMASFLNTPPSIEAAQLFASPALNVLDCAIKEGAIEVSKSHIGRCQPEVVASGLYKLAFPPETVRWNDIVGPVVVRTGQSDCYCFVQVLGNSRCSLIGPACDQEPHQFVVAGSAALFTASGKFVQRIDIAEPGVTAKNSKD